MAKVYMHEKKERDLFEEWSDKWDVIFKLCGRGKLPWERLLSHTMAYNEGWNYKK